jgi:hypothetical protein
MAKGEHPVWEKIKSALSYLAVVLTAALYFMWDRRGKRIEELEAEKIRDEKEKVINEEKQKAADAVSDYERARDEYERIRGRKE